VSPAPPPPPSRAPFGAHVVVCHGTSCTERGQGLPARELRNALFEGGLQGTVRVTKATCLNLCSLAPNCVVYGAGAAEGTPAGGAWYPSLTPTKVRRIVDEHLRGGRPVADLLLRWDHPDVAT
jgi:(2Fe-2S) ferredoxin